MTRTTDPHPELSQDGRSLRRASLGLAVGGLVFVFCLVLPTPEGMSDAAWRTAAVALLMAIWWITEAVPVAVTALLPLALFAPVGAGSIGEASAPYANPIIYLFLGGFLLALAIERWGLHRRIALGILSLVGSRGDRIVGGFLFGTAALSMWLSNTATSVMMLPIAMSVLGLLEEGDDPSAADDASDGQRRRNGDLPRAVLLGLAYGASIGGIATLVGTPPNAMLAGFLSETYGVELGFGRWMMFGLPLSLLMQVAAWLLLTKVCLRVGHEVPGAAERIRQERRQLGGWSTGERRIAWVFGLTASAWILRPQLQRIFGIDLSDTGIAMIASIVLFLVPVERHGAKVQFLMSWRRAERVPWGVLLLFGGGLSLADRINATGLGAWIGERLVDFGSLPIWVLLLVVIATVVFLTELTSNAATTATFLPVLAAVAISVGESPMLFAIPAAVGASYAFMMPVATPPNAIVYGSGRITIPEMSRVGLWLNLLAIVLILGFSFVLMGLAFGVEIGVLPAWAR